MKKLMSILVVAIMVMSLAVVAYADVDVADTYVNHLEEKNFDVATVDLPADVAEGETVTIKIKGTADANFRVYLGNGLYPDRESDIQVVEVVDGAFDTEFTLTVAKVEDGSNGLANNIVIKGASYGVAVPAITWESFVIVGAEETAPVEDTNTEAPADETVENTETADETTPAETGIALAVVPMMVAAAAVVASKRR